MGIRLETTPLHFGGFRWWGRCPLEVSGAPCGRRVGKLHLPPGGRYFGCRKCYGLTYQSAQRRDKRIDALRRDPAALARLAENLETVPIAKRLLVLKALMPRW
jgi:hypothetical protein